MTWLLDTGVLLRMVDGRSELAGPIDEAIVALIASGCRLACGSQNVAEFWAAATRPAEHRGLGWTLAIAAKRLAIIEARVAILHESPESYDAWKGLLGKHNVAGKQVHDCRIAALMISHGIADILTLNADDFRRFPEVRASTPAAIVATP